MYFVKQKHGALLRNNIKELISDNCRLIADTAKLAVPNRGGKAIAVKT